MRLYHGSNTSFQEIDLGLCRPDAALAALKFLEVTDVG